jgi:RNA polymerase sigma-70 factor (ECF subfamily)
MVELSELNMNQKTHSKSFSTLAIDAKNNPTSFAVLYNHYIQPVYRYLRSRVQTTQEAEDLTSQTFMTAYERMHAYQERGYFSAWVFRIARSKLIDHYRGSKPFISLDMIENTATMGDTLGQVVHQDEIQILKQIIHDLDEEQRDLIQLRYVANLSFAEIAQILGKREAAVKKSLYRLLAGIKSRME